MKVQNLRRDVMEFITGKASQDVELDQLVQALSNPVVRECTFDDNMASGSEATEKDFWRRCRVRREDLRMNEL
jgi:hypothetical protein